MPNKQLIRVQIPGSYNETEDFVGLEAAILNFGKSLKGAQIGLLNLTKENSYGAQLGFANVNDDEFLGFRVGVFNFSDYFRGFSFGLLNIYKESTGFRVGGINATIESGHDEYSSGLDVALINKAQDGYGLQLGILNFVRKELQGVQVGLLYCSANEGNYLQLGLITYRANRNKWYQKLSPFIGFGNKEKDSKKHKE